MIAISFLVRSEAILARLRNKKRTGHAPGPFPLVFLRYPPVCFLRKLARRSAPLGGLKSSKDFHRPLPGQTLRSKHIIGLLTDYIRPYGLLLFLLYDFFHIVRAYLSHVTQARKLY